MPKTYNIVASGSAIYNRHSYNPGTNGLKHRLSSFLSLRQWGCNILLS